MTMKIYWSIFVFSFSIGLWEECLPNLRQHFLEGEVEPIVQSVGAHDPLIFCIQYDSSASLVLVVLQKGSIDNLKSALILISFSFLQHEFMVFVLQISEELFDVTLILFSAQNFERRLEELDH